MPGKEAKRGGQRERPGEEARGGGLGRRPEEEARGRKGEDAEKQEHSCPEGTNCSVSCGRPCDLAACCPVHRLMDT